MYFAFCFSLSVTQQAKFRGQFFFSKFRKFVSPKIFDPILWSPGFRVSLNIGDFDISQE